MGTMGRKDSKICFPLSLAQGQFLSFQNTTSPEINAKNCQDAYSNIGYRNDV